MFWLIPIGLGLIGAAGAASGAMDLHDANNRTNRARARFDDAQARLEWRRGEVIGHAQHQVGWITYCRDSTIAPLAAWITAHAGTSGVSEVEFITEVATHVPERPLSPSVAAVLPNLLVGGVGALLGATAAPTAVMALATTFGTASTGAAISGLTGAAAESAALALLGGGALAAGGGGVTVGTALLTASVPAVGILLAGGALFMAGDRASTDSHRYAAQVDTDVAAMEAAHDLLNGMDWRMTEVRNVLGHLGQLSLEANDRLFAIEAFDPTRDAAAFAEAILLAKAISEISTMPIIDPETGHFNDALDALVHRHKESNR